MTFQLLFMIGTPMLSKGRHIANGESVDEPERNTFDRTQVLTGLFLEHRFNTIVTLRKSTRHTCLDKLYRSTALSGCRNRY